MTAKRIMDLTLAGAGVLLLWPLLLSVGLCVLTAMGRPVFFCQRRVGRGGRDFSLFKFRTMAPGPAAARDGFQAGDTSRVTPLGTRLRRLKLDELPQLFNVLRGDMSLVGPRPEVRRWVDECPRRWARLLAQRPGITDEASLRFKDEERLLAASLDPETMYREVILPQKLDLYQRYQDRRTLASDLKVLLATAGALLPRGHQS